MITSDHGMNADKSHGGTLPEERDIPLFVIGAGFSHRPDAAPKQTEICGSICELLGIVGHNKPFAHKTLQDAQTTVKPCIAAAV
ncbi:hypothetical protein AB4876_15650 [Zhongshania guokunii]|uniref:Metalloenzyme domain-containing protein n=1 Tax=Zhongshania guokunii TaxID=641783 RepID=A0ABV3U8V7_9GAMM